MHKSSQYITNLKTVEGPELRGIVAYQNSPVDLKLTLADKRWSPSGVCRCQKCGSLSFWGPYSLRKLKVGDRCVDKPCPSCEPNNYVGNDCFVVAVSVPTEGV